MTHGPTLYLRDVPPAVYEALRQRADGNGRTVGGEALAILTAALREESEKEFE